MKLLRFAVIGTGFWANYQISAWMELDGVELVAVCDQVKSKAEATARRFNVPAAYDSADDLFANEELDFVDVITGVDTHALFTEMAAKKGIAVICQKPMAPSFPTAKQMVDTCRLLHVPFFIQENFRWQAPMRKMKALLSSGAIGEVFKARVTFCSAFPVFDNQPFLAELHEFILTDVGSHTLDLCRFLFGEVESLLCRTHSINPKIKGEDVANVFMTMKNGTSCYAEMSYASLLEYESFPQTFALAEGNAGSIHLAKDCSIHVTTQHGTQILKAEPVMYPWVDPQYALVHSSIVSCNRDILGALAENGKAETTGEDNLETVRLVHAAYASAKTGQLIHLDQFR